MTLPYIACICATYNRPVLLAEMVQCFIEQDYPKDRCELVVLDDAGQYTLPSSLPANVRLCVIPQRFRTLGEKRNATAALASPQATVYSVWDDDDLYLPHTLQFQAKALQQAEFVIPKHVYTWDKPASPWTVKNTGGIFHGCWAFTRSVFEAVNGYPWIQSGQDLGLKRKLLALDGCRLNQPECDRPYYVYRWTATGDKHLSAMDKATGYDRMKAASIEPAQLTPRFQQDYWQMIPGEV